MNRRAFLSGLIAAPAVIRVAPLMRIVPVPLMTAWEIEFLDGFNRETLRTSIPTGVWRQYYNGKLIDKLTNPPVLELSDGTIRLMKPYEIWPGFHELPSPLS